jgi:hypothetical protein
MVVPNELTCGAYGDFCAYTVGDVVVDTTIQTQITWNGDLGGSIYTTVNINTANNCGNGFAYTGYNINCFGEYYSYASVDVVPSSYGSQSYFINAVNTSAYDFCRC